MEEFTLDTPSATPVRGAFAIKSLQERDLYATPLSVIRGGYNNGNQQSILPPGSALHNSEVATPQKDSNICNVCVCVRIRPLNALEVRCMYL